MGEKTDFSPKMAFCLQGFRSRRSEIPHKHAHRVCKCAQLNREMGVERQSLWWGLRGNAPCVPQHYKEKQ